MKKKILFVFGTRPETIKMAPVIKLFRESKDFDAIVCTTGQHREMLDQSMRIFGLESDYELQVMNSYQVLLSLSTLKHNQNSRNRPCHLHSLDMNAIPTHHPPRKIYQTFQIRTWIESRIHMYITSKKHPCVGCCDTL